METITFSDSTNRFEFSDDIYTANTISVDGAATFGSTVSLNGVTYTFPGADGSNGYVLTTNAAGTLTWSSKTEGSVTQSEGDSRYVEIAGDTMTGALKVQANISGSTLNVDGAADINGSLDVQGTSTLGGATTISSTLDTTGNITTDANLTINEDNGAANAVLTFGNDAGAENITFSDSTNRFEFSDDLYTASTITVDGAATLGSTLTIGGVAYTFPTSDGSASGKVLKTNSAGQLSWSADIDTNTNAQTICAINQYLDGNGDCADVIEEAEMDSIGELETQVGSVNIIVSTEIDAESELEALLSDVSDVYTNNDGDLLSQSGIDSRYVEIGGDTMTGALKVQANLSGSTLNVDGAADINGSLDVQGTSTLGGAVTASSTIDAVGNITTDGTLQVNDDNTGNAQLIFGNDAGDETITFNDTSNEFDISDDVNVTGTFDTTGNITTDANLTINEDNGGVNAVLTFGNDAGAETITFSDSTNRFEFSDDIYTANTLTVDGAATFGSTVAIGGVTYTYPTSDGSASGKVLATDGSGQLSWTDAAGANGSGNTIFLSPGYPHAVYFASGSSAIGQLYASGGNLSNLENNYTWTSSKSGIQDYWVSTRVKIPHNFSSWAPTPIQFRYRTGTATASQNHVTVKFFDTTGTEIALTGGGGLTSTSWATANITGPQGSGTYTADSYITIMVKLASTSTASAQANAGSMNLNWRTTTP